MKKTIVTFVGFVCVLSVLVTFSNCNVYKCPNGEIVRFPAHPERQYRQYVVTTNSNLKATIDVLGKVKIADLDAGTTSQVTELREKLNQYSSQTEDAIKAMWAAYCTTPCDTMVRRKYFDYISEIAKENAALQKMKEQVSNSVYSGNMAGIDSRTLLKIISDYNANASEKIFEKH